VSDFEKLIESMVPGLGHLDVGDADSPDFPVGLGLEPLEVLGRGGTGWVYRAEDATLCRTVAVKVSRPDGGEAAREAIRREAQVTAALECPGVLPVHRVVESGDQVCVVFQLAPEQTLADLDLASLSNEKKWALLHEIIRTLVRAHDIGVRHGDLHPRNVAVGSLGEAYVMDWGGGWGVDGSFTGHPGYAAPELLHGGSPTPASDVFSWAAVAWELLCGGSLRNLVAEEALGEAISRWRDAPLPALPEGIEPELGALLLACLDPDPSERPNAEAVERRLHAVLTGRSERARRLEESRALVAQSQVLLDEYRDLSEAFQDEMRVVAVQRTKIMDAAPAAQKRPLWDAEDRLKSLMVQQETAWVHAVEGALRAWTLAPENRDARGLLADLWWLRFRQLEAGAAEGETQVSLEWVRKFDDGRYARLLEGEGSVSLSCGEVEGQVRIEGFVEQDRRLEPFLVRVVDLPLERVPLEPGSWLLTVTAPGFQDCPYPVSLRRREHHKADLVLQSEEAVGEGWVYMPAGAFHMGGDPIARQVTWRAGGRGPLRTFRAGGDPLAKEALEACSPTVRGCFMMRTCVRSADYLAFLNSLGADAAPHVPGEAGLYGDFRPYWTQEGSAWTLPADWNPDWPVVAVNIEDASAYAAWLSQELGRECRLPTEEEWEKAARGVDARAFPWGPSFDPTFAHMRRSRTGAPSLWPVGQYPVDCSVYGCMDMAGGVREWTASAFSEGQVVVRGGGWNDDMDELRCAGRRGLPPHFRSSSVGFRLVSELPAPTGR
jgi:serine/threonine-protein kinase